MDKAIRIMGAVSRFICVTTYPSAGGQRETRGMRVPRKEYARSRHQRLFEENVEKTGKRRGLRTLSERFGSCIYARGRY